MILFLPSAAVVDGIVSSSSSSTATAAEGRRCYVTIAIDGLLARGYVKDDSYDNDNDGTSALARVTSPMIYDTGGGV